MGWMDCEGVEGVIVSTRMGFSVNFFTVCLHRRYITETVYA